MPGSGYQICGVAGPRRRPIGQLQRVRAVVRLRLRLLRNRGPGLRRVAEKLPRKRFRGRSVAACDVADRRTYNAVGFRAVDDAVVVDGSDLHRLALRPERVVRLVHRARAVRVNRDWGGSPSMIELGLAGAVLVDYCPHAGDDDQLSSLASRSLATLLDQRDRELHSVRIRRAARRLIAPRADARTISVLLASNRPQCLADALRSIAGQTVVAHEVLIGMHGPGWGPEHATLVHDLLGEVAGIVRFERSIPFGAVLQALSERASGDLVTKWDDDDWYGVHHLEDLAGAIDDSGADLVGKAAEFVHLETAGLTIRRFASGAERYSSTLAGGTLMLRTDTLAEIGGWAPAPRDVDRLLIRSLRRSGGLVYRTHGFEYLLRRTGAGHTWDVSDEYFLEQATDVRAGLDLAFCGIDD